MTNDEYRRNDEIRMTNLAASTFFRHLTILPSFIIRHSCFVIPPYARPVFSSSVRINRSRARSFRLERNWETGRCIRRVQFELVAVPGTLKRYLRASRSVIMTMAIHDSQLNSASMIEG